jgi:hypothetical protein
VIIVSEHPLDLDHLLLAHVSEDDVQNGRRHSECRTQALQGAEAFEQQPAQHQIQH